MSFRRLGIFVLLACLSLAACGDLPEPFLGNPGATARRLAQPLTPLLAVPPGTDTMFPDAANRDLANRIAAGLQATEVPALVREPQRTDWRVLTTARREGDTVKPIFTIQDPQGKEQGSAEGEPVPLQDWSTAAPDLLQQIAAEAAPRIGAVLTGIQTARNKADPNSLYNRLARVQVTDVTGAPGDGDQTLTQQMRSRLAVLGPVVLTTPTGADFVVQGQVKVVPVPKRLERIEIQWIIKTGSGDERGRVIQLNEIPAGSLDHYWGDIAVVVATEASNGVNDVIRRQSGKDASGKDASEKDAGTKDAVGKDAGGTDPSSHDQPGHNPSGPGSSGPASSGPASLGNDPSAKRPASG